MQSQCETHIQWTGNPFVDTGLAVMVARANSLNFEISEPSELTAEILRQVVGDGSWLADANRQLNAFSIVFGSNSPLTQSGTNPSFVLAGRKRKIANAHRDLAELKDEIAKAKSEKKKKILLNKQQKLNETIVNEQKKIEATAKKNLSSKTGQHSEEPEGDKGLLQYKIVIQTLLEDVILNNHSLSESCECTGILPATNALYAAYQVIRARKLNSKRDEEFNVGRDWFPLAGSIGNDAQALPAASRAPQVSALALLAVQFLPLGVLLYNGQAALFQSTEPSITQILVSDIYRRTTARLDVATDKVEPLGKQAGTTPIAQILLEQFLNLRQHKRMQSLPANTALNLWLFMNSGTSAAAGIIAIPHPALVFLWEASRDYAPDLKLYLENEKRMRSENQLLSSVMGGREYQPFYPWKEQTPAKIGLFEFFQQLILNRSQTMLQMACCVAAKLSTVIETTSAKDLQQLRKSMGNSSEMRSLRPRLKALFAEWAEEGDFTLEDYVSLFPCECHPVRAGFEGWNLIWFYLNHSLGDVKKPIHKVGDTMFTHPAIKRFAADVFAVYQQEIGLPKFQKRILGGFRRGEIDNSRLRGWFIDLAERGYESYSNEAWDDLCRDENGNDRTFEVRFQLRLELANLYAQAVKTSA